MIALPKFGNVRHKTDLSIIKSCKQYYVCTSRLRLLGETFNSFLYETRKSYVRLPVEIVKSFLLNGLLFEI